MSTEVAISCPALHRRITDKRSKTSGEVPWTNVDADDWEEQSSAAHIAGFFVTHTTAACCRKSAVPSRKKEAFEGWETHLEVPVGRPQEWTDVRTFNQQGLATEERDVPHSTMGGSSSSSAPQQGPPQPPPPPAVPSNAFLEGGRVYYLNQQRPWGRPTCFGESCFNTPIFGHTYCSNCYKR